MSDPAERLAVLETEMERVKDDIRDIRSDVSALKRFQQWMIGAGAAVGFFFGMFADAIRDRLGLS